MSKYKKSLSTVVAALLLVLLTLVLIGIVWTVVNNLVTEELDEAGSCFDVFDKITFNGIYTCYNSSSNEMQFSINVKDISISKAVVSVVGEGRSKSIEIPGQYSSVKPFNGAYNSSISLPEKNAGLTYIYSMTADGFTQIPDTLKIIPVVRGNQCDVSDSIEEIDNC